MADTGKLASLATSYDLAFLHGILAELEGAPVEQAPCTALPFRKVPIRRLSVGSQRWLAAVNYLLMAAKCQDDVADEGGWKGRLGLRMISSRLEWARQVMAESGFPVEAVAGLPDRQALAERSVGSSLEALALPTSSMLGEVFSHAAVLSRRPEMRIPLRHLGQGLGLAIYLKDALEDLDKDTRLGRFNALTASGQGETYLQAALRREVRRALQGLEAVGLGEGHALPTILGALPQPAAPVPSPLARLRRRKAIAGDCIPCCDCGVCCDFGTCCDGAACSGADCGPCTCDCCAGCGTTSTTTSEAVVVGAAALVEKPKVPCPACGELMLCRTYSGSEVSASVEVDECGACHGLWLDRDELEQLSDMGTVPARLLTPKPVVPPQVRPEGTRPCPRCAEFLTTVPIKGVRVDLCHSCQGLFLDQGELNELLDSV